MNDKTKHGCLCHYRGQTSNNNDFVYCPVGNIVSWARADYENRWCHYCKLYLYEIDDTNNIQKYSYKSLINLVSLIMAIVALFISLWTLL